MVRGEWFVCEFLIDIDLIFFVVWFDLIYFCFSFYSSLVGLVFVCVYVMNVCIVLH